MDKAIIINFFRFLGLVLVQGLILKRFSIGGDFFQNALFFLYPVLIFILPLRTPTTLLVATGFLLGLFVDFFYGTVGLHAATTVFVAYSRHFVTRFLEPRGGYDIKQSPTIHFFGINWFLKYSGILLFIHLFFYFSVEAFSFVYILDIMLKTFLSFIFSYILIMMFIFIFNPKE